MPTQEEIDEQQRLLAVHRKTLDLLLTQRAQHTGAYVPPSIEHGISEARVNIQQIKDVLRDWGVLCADLPNDGSTSFETSSKISAAFSELPPPVKIRPTMVLIILLMVSLVGLAIWSSFSRSTSPSANKNGIDFANEAIPLNILQAYPVFAAVDSTQKIEFYLKPEIKDTQSEKAKGVITVINRIGQDIILPKETEFVAIDQAGKEIRFVIDGPVTIPKAVTVSSPTGSSTTYGSIDIIVTAHVSGNVSNIGSDAITKILIPGQEPIDNGTVFLIRHGPISGGNDQPTYTYALTEKDLRWIQDKALTDLFENGLQHLRIQADKYGNALDLVGINPGQVALNDPKNYELLFEPPIGQPIDPGNTTISVTVRARFTALATPRDNDLVEQMKLVLPQYFRQYNKFSCNNNESASVSIRRWYWDGSHLMADGVIRCTVS